MRWQLIRSISLGLAVLAASPLVVRAQVPPPPLAANYDEVAALPPLQLPNAPPGSSGWGMDNLGPDATPLPTVDNSLLNPGPVPAEEPVGDVTPRLWMPGRYLGRGVEYTGQLCGVPDDWCPPRNDPSPRINISAYQGFEQFRGIPDGAIAEKGIVQGINTATAVPWLDQFGIGFQAGATYGAYNLSGSPNREIPTADVSQQTFVTTGFFRRATINCPLSAGIVYDWMITDHLGTLSQSPTLGQGRVQIAYAFTARNEFGINASFDTREHYTGYTTSGPVGFRPVSQGNFFWRHKFWWRNAEGRLWGGPTDAIRENGQNSEGKIVMGVSFYVPITDRVAFNFQGISWDTDDAGASHRDVYDFSAGFTFYPQRTARTSTVAGRQWTPYLPVATNSTFLWDTTRVTP
ncbi:MAG TPA: DUF6666 family protein [Pirellulales bacterium]|nr:DUF6666 family protein [Pirellulales bacterium]